jgi:hypothetical protein
MAYCFYHPRRKADWACAECGRMICIECRAILENKVYCEPCVSKIFVRTQAKAEAAPAAAPTPPPATAQAAAPAPTAKEKVSSAWWLLPIFLVFVGGIIAWAPNRDKNPRKAGAMLGWGIGLTFLYAALTFLGLFIKHLIDTGVLRFKWLM